MEFALVLPVMLLILVIAADFGRLFFSYVQVMNAAREGASYASLHAADSPFDGTAYSNGVTAAATGEANVQGQSGEGGLNVDPPVCFDPLTFDPLTQTPTIDCNVASDFAGRIGNHVRVTVREDFTFLTPIISGLVGVLPLTASATAPVHNPPVAPPTPEPTPVPGSLVVRKVLAGDLTDFNGGEFTFEVTCNGVDLGEVTIDLASGAESSDPVTGITPGSICTVTEIDQPNAGPHASWDSPGPEQATITSDSQEQVTITNTRTYSAPVDGSLVVTKVLDGDYTDFAGGDFTFDVSCDGTNYGPVRIPLSSGTGSTDPITGIPADANCTVTETTRPEAGPNASWVGSMGTTTVTIEKNKQADAVITNTRTYTAPCESPLVTITPATTSDTSKKITVIFTGTAAGSPSSWTWDFGDGISATGVTVTHDFLYTKGNKGSGAQEWKVTLTTAGGACGTTSAQATVTLDYR